jgi:hypothetical protein
VGGVRGPTARCDLLGNGNGNAAPVELQPVDGILCVGNGLAKLGFALAVAVDECRAKLLRTRVDVIEEGAAAIGPAYLVGDHESGTDAENEQKNLGHDELLVWG